MASEIAMVDMDTLTLEQAQEGHRALWDWLAESDDRWQKDWPGWSGYSRMSTIHCFPCELCKRDCDSCPIEWPGENCLASGSPYPQWYDGTDAERKATAAQIRDLPWKEREHA
ncbi:MAG: hypothetical protein LBS45_12240 [Synergistaceae bacterium]|jgi:hypothetical protein|nr:hypothetical protein [Synergistaceae bacterium]